MMMMMIKFEFSKFRPSDKPAADVPHADEGKKGAYDGRTDEARVIVGLKEKNVDVSSDYGTTVQQGMNEWMHG
jgi:hypothetical protein